MAQGGTRYATAIFCSQICYLWCYQKVSLYYFKPKTQLTFHKQGHRRYKNNEWTHLISVYFSNLQNKIDLKKASKKPSLALTLRTSLW